MTPPVRFLALGEAGLLVAGLLWAWMRSIPIPFRIDAEAVLLALLATAAFTVVNLSLYRFSKRIGRPAPVHQFLETELLPLFRSLSIWEVILLVLLAGLGEEIFFRGALQQEIGLLGASLIFGILHGPSRPLWVLAVWATVMGAALGHLYDVTQNLFVPVVAHALYDGAAVAYVRLSRGQRPSPPEESSS